VLEPSISRHPRQPGDAEPADPVAAALLLVSNRVETDHSSVASFANDIAVRWLDKKLVDPWRDPVTVPP